MPVSAGPKNRSITLLDRAPLPEQTLGPAWSWDLPANAGGVRSLLRYCEDHADRLRSVYCRWVHDLGATRTKDGTIVSDLELEPGLSYWWLTLIVERSVWKSPGIHQAIRFIAWEEILRTEAPARLTVVSADALLDQVLRPLAASLGINYEWRRLPSARRRPCWREAYKRLPFVVQGSIALTRYLYDRWGFRRGGAAGWFSGPGAVFFCSYFFNVSGEQAERGRFHSRYWQELHALLRRQGCRTNWLQLYYPNMEVGSPETARRWVADFNRAPTEEGMHGFLDAQLSWPVVLRVLWRWQRLVRTSWRLGTPVHAFRPSGAELTLWPVLRRDWGDSLEGATAVKNLLWIELFDSVLRQLPRQERGFYLCEGQGWERAMLHAWNKYGHGDITAVPHSTRSFWDLRFYREPCDAAPRQRCPLPQPTTIAVNGPAAREHFLRENYPLESLLPCEALRYGQLVVWARARRPALANRREDGAVRILILGDYLAEVTAAMLDDLAAQTGRFDPGIRFTIKPHPNSPVRAEDYPDLPLAVVTSPLDRILVDYDLAYSSNATSAAVDAYLGGLAVVIQLETNKLNLSPLRGWAEIRFVGGAEGLAEAVADFQRGAWRPGPARELFDYDADLPRWRRLLSPGTN